MEKSLSALARQCRSIALMIVGGLALAMAFDLWISMDAMNSPAGFLGVLARLFPALFYLGAVWFCAGSFAAIAAGAHFTDALPVLMRKIGWLIVGGASASTAVMPILSRLVMGSGSYVRFDVSDLALGMIGLMLVVLARILTEAVAMRSELEEFV